MLHFLKPHLLVHLKDQPLIAYQSALIAPFVFLSESEIEPSHSDDRYMSHLPALPPRTAKPK